jgi:hypothetical protein
VTARAFALALLSLAVLASARAEAFVQTTTADGHGFFWQESCVPATIYLNGFEKKTGMTVDQIVKSVTAAAHAWSTDAVSCKDSAGNPLPPPYLEIVPTLAPISAKPPAVTDPSIPGSWDTKNTITFRTEMWTRNGVPITPTSPASDLYDNNALAVTTVTARSDGHIVDVDMEVNGVSKQWLNLDPGVPFPSGQGEPDFFDLQNALTHEFGHFIGLSHTCFTASADNPLVGTDGKLRPNGSDDKPVPDCDAAPSDVANTVMFNVTMAGETSQRNLAPDDINAVCTIYAASKSAGTCALDTPPASCAIAPLAPAHRNRRWTLGLPVALLVAAATVARRRTRRA